MDTAVLVGPLCVSKDATRLGWVLILFLWAARGLGSNLVSGFHSKMSGSCGIAFALSPTANEILLFSLIMSFVGSTDALIRLFYHLEKNPRAISMTVGKRVVFTFCVFAHGPRLLCPRKGCEFSASRI